MTIKVRALKIPRRRKYRFDGEIKYDGQITFDNVYPIWAPVILQNKIIDPDLILSRSTAFEFKVMRFWPVDPIPSRAQVFTPTIFVGLRISVDLIPSRAQIFVPDFQVDLLPSLIRDYNTDLYYKLKDMKNETFDTVGQSTAEPYFSDLFRAIVDYIRAEELDDSVINMVQTVYSYFTFSYVYDTEDTLMSEVSVPKVYTMDGMLQVILDYPVDYYNELENIENDTIAINQSITTDADRIFDDYLTPMRDVLKNQIDDVKDDSTDTPQLELLNRQLNYDTVMVDTGYEAFMIIREQDYEDIMFLF